MVNRSNLFPVHTVDKNGRQTTVYRKPVASASVRSVPAPDVSPSCNDELVREAAGILLKDLYPGGSGSNDAALRRMVVSAIRSYSEKLVVEIRDAVTGLDDSVDSENLRESLSELIGQSPSESKVREALILFPAVCKWSLTVGGRIIDSLREYDQIPSWSDLSRESDEVKNKCVAMATVVSEVYSFRPMFTTKGESDIVLQDDALVELIFEFPERARQIADAINERESADPALLRSIIASDSRVLGDGSL